MRALVAASILFMAGCADRTEPAAATDVDATASDAAAATPAQDDTQGLPPADAAPTADATTAAADAELEAAIRATAPDYRSDIVGSEDAAKARYAAARKDLNGDGRDEVFVYLMGPFFCGTGGCNLLVFSQGMDGYSLLANIALSRPPVIVADTASNGYADVWRQQSGGGASAQFVQHVFKDGKYVEQSRTAIDQPPAGTTVIKGDIEFTDGLVLEPRG